MEAGTANVDFTSIGRALTAETSLQSLGATLGTFVQLYGGGPGAPFIKFLDVISKEFDDTVALGSDFWESVTTLKACSTTTSLPLLRVALLASNICCPRACVLDGVARLHLKKDVARLQSPKAAAAIVEGEELLADCWRKISGAALPHSKACRIFGRACARCVSFLLQKKSHEAVPESLEAVKTSFESELAAKELKAATAAVPASSSSAVSGFVTLAEASDSLFLTQQKVKLEPGQLYLHKDYPDKLFELQYLKGEAAYLLYENALQTERLDVVVLLAEASKSLKLSKASIPRLLTASETRDRADAYVSAIPRMQSQVWLKVLDMQQELEPQGADLLLEFPTKRVYAGRDFKKGELILVPCTDSPNKISPKKPKSGAAGAEVHLGGAVFWALPPKSLREEKDGSFQGSSTAYWFLGKGNEEGQMIHKGIENDAADLVCVVLQNKRAVKKHELLEVYETADTPAASARKRKG